LYHPVEHIRAALAIHQNIGNVLPNLKAAIRAFDCGLKELNLDRETT
jgi:hypothetical protein